MNPPEFSRPVRIDTLGPGPRAISIRANAEERAALAIRFDLQSIEHLSAEAELTLSNGTVRANGTLVARVTQSCVATGGPVPAKLTEDFGIEFRPEPAGGRAEEEIELSPGELDVVFFDGASVDLGEAVAETLSLALNPYPRCAEADAELADVGVVKEGDEPPSGPLAGLKDLLERKN